MCRLNIIIVISDMHLLLSVVTIDINTYDCMVLNLPGIIRSASARRLVGDGFNSRPKPRHNKRH